MTARSQLLSGYAAYTDAAEFGATASAVAPNSTPSIIAASALSSGACGAAAGGAVTSVITGVTVTHTFGC